MIEMIKDLIKLCKERNELSDIEFPSEDICDKCPKKELCDALYELSYGMRDTPSCFEMSRIKKGYKVIKRWEKGNESCTSD